MEKKIEKKYVGFEKEFKARSWEDDSYDIDEVIEFFINAKKEGATHAQWKASCDDGCSYSCDVYTFYNETETDEDFEKRVSTEKDKNKALNIADVIGSASFQKAIKDAIERGKGIDYGYDGENEYSYDTFDSDESLHEVIRVLKEYFL